MKPINTLPSLAHLAFIAAMLGLCLAAPAIPDVVASSAKNESRIAVTQFGAVGDGQTLNTRQIQTAINRLHAGGGGVLVFPRGVFLSGALFLKPGVHLHLEKDAVIKASTDVAKNFPSRRTRIEGHFEENFTPALINADGCDGLRITGEGTLDGDGRVIWDDFWKQRRASANPKNFKNTGLPRARLCLIENSSDVLVQGVTFKDSQFWNLHLYKCRNVSVVGARFEVPGDYKQAPSTDGIDLDSCRDVVIENCHFSITDDCIAMKGSKGPDALEDKDSPPVERVRISGCVFRRGHSMFTCGSEATIVRDILVENCEVTGAMPLMTLKLRPDTPQHYENITVRDITVRSDSARLFSINRWTQFFDLKGRPEPASRVANIKVSGIRGRIGSLGAIRGNDKTEFGEIIIEDVDVTAKNERLSLGKNVAPAFKNVTVNGKPFATPAAAIIRNGIPWFDTDGNIVNAHGACIVEDGGRYYLFGEWKSDESNAFPGFSCYSSDDLVTWKFERVVLPVQPDGILGPNRVGERVKVMKCPSTGEYVMYMHADNMAYKDPHVGYATSPTIAGEYKFQGPLLFDGKPIRRWDMGTFQDTDGKGYLLIHHGIIYRLGDDYRSAEARVLNGLPKSGESPAMFKKNGLYYLLGSGLTSWEKNDNFYFTAPAIEGPWTRRGFFAPEGSLTFYSQTTFVLPLARGDETIPMFMGDRWSFPHQASAATYVWMPMRVDGEKLSMPEYWQAWDIKTMKPVDPLAGGKTIPRSDIKLENKNDWKTDGGQFASRVKGGVLEASFNGTRVALTGETNSQSGYARVRILNKNGVEILSALVDFYSKIPDRAMRFLSPRLPGGDYKIIVEVTGISPVWTDKSKTIFGSKDTFVTIENVVVFSD